jgi:DNA-binding NarL/FixJ family response regulator
VFYPPHDIINSEKKQILRNLYESGVSEEIIAEHLDLDVGTVKILIEQISA